MFHKLILIVTAAVGMGLLGAPNAVAGHHHHHHHHWDRYGYYRHYRPYYYEPYAYRHHYYRPYYYGYRPYYRPGVAFSLGFGSGPGYYGW